MKKIFQIIYVLALVGFVLSLIVHLSTYVGINPQEYFPPVWLLHIGIFIVFIPALPGLRALNKQRDSGEKECNCFIPKWINVLRTIFCYYAIINFMFFMILMKDGSPKIISGHYVISDHGKNSRIISEKEYEQYKSYEVRGFSGHWMVFYLVSATGLFVQSQRKKDK